MKKIFAIAALMSTAAFADQVQLVGIDAGSPLGDDTYTFNYQFAVADGVSYVVGDFFTIYDFDSALAAIDPARESERESINEEEKCSPFLNDLEIERSGFSISPSRPSSR